MIKLSATKVIRGYWKAFDEIRHMKDFTSNEVLHLFDKSPAKTSGLLQSYSHRGYFIKIKTLRNNQQIYILSPKLKLEIDRYLIELENNI